jgi:hypothetical protein
MNTTRTNADVLRAALTGETLVVTVPETRNGAGNVIAAGFRGTVTGVDFDEHTETYGVAVHGVALDGRFQLSNVLYVIPASQIVDWFTTVQTTV